MLDRLLTLYADVENLVYFALKNAEEWKMKPGISDRDVGSVVIMRVEKSHKSGGLEYKFQAGA